MTESILFILAQATPSGGQSSGGSPLGMLVPLICFGVIFYFLLIRPQTKKQKEHEALVKSVKTGDKVITSGGIHGLISNVKDTTVTLKVADNVKIEVEKSAIGTVVKSAAAEA
jgi:preprotein translocase subunit YajC